MKRLARIALCFFLSFAFACAPAASTSSAPSTEATETPMATATPAPTAEPAPEPLGMAPADLLGTGYNLFFDVAFPAGYTVYGARFDSAQPNKGRGDLFMLNLTAEGDRLEIVRYCAELLGVTDKATLTAYADSMTNDGFADITGTYAGATAYAWLKQTDAGYESDQIPDVGGCRVELAVDLTSEQAEQYRALVLANYSTAMLGDLADRFGEDTIRRDMLCIFVNALKLDKTEVYVSHEVQDAAGLFTEMTEKLQTSWFDEAYANMGIDYAMQRVKYSFNLESNIVNAQLSPNDNTTPAGEFKLSDVSLTKFGFQHFPQDGLAIYKEDQNHLEIAISKPEWHRTAEDWNFEFLGESNGYPIGMWYKEATETFLVTASKGDTSVGCNYDVATETFDDGWTEMELMQSIFRGATGSDKEDARAEFFALLNEATQQRFGMTWQELYALPVW